MINRVSHSLIVMDVKFSIAKLRESCGSDGGIMRPYGGPKPSHRGVGFGTLSGIGCEE